MKRIFILLVVAIALATNGMAQALQEVVYLKNGSIIRGTIIEQVPNQSLKVQTADGSVFVYQMSEVEKITKEESKAKKSVYDHGHRGLDYSIGGGLMVGKGGTAMGDGFFEIGKRFTPNFYWGIGAGVLGGSGSDLYVPITTKFQALFPVTQSGIAPNVAVRTGFMANTNIDNSYSRHALLFAILPGVQIPLGQKVDLNINLGYACTLICGNGWGADHFFMTNIGFGFHKPWDKTSGKRNTAFNRWLGRTYAELELGANVGGGSWNDNTYRGNGNFSQMGTNLFIHAIWMTPIYNHLDAGIGSGVGIEPHIVSSTHFKDIHAELTIPLFVRAQYRLYDKSKVWTPYAAFDLGYRFVLNEAANAAEKCANGLLFEPHIGVIWKGWKAGIGLGAGTYGLNDKHIPVTFNFRLGYTFGK